MRDPFWAAAGAALMASCCYLALLPQPVQFSEVPRIDTESALIPVWPLPQAAWPSFHDIKAPHYDDPVTMPAFTVLGYMHLQGRCAQFVRYAGSPDVRRQSCTTH